ncbi:protein terminal ear1-like [Bidens hawaiensis]|uniref:protein terminal ear1-like n=1 Tax=Bidens hawaiensis TaxID=980011 RepID=UPI0040497987
MAEARVHRLPPPLNPTAQEFIPTYNNNINNNVYYTCPIIIPPTPTRALVLTSVPTHVSESTVRRDLELFGDVRAVQMDRLRDGILTVHFYDIRHACDALNNIQQHVQQQCRVRQYFDGHMVWSFASPPPVLQARGLVSGQVVWAQFAYPVAAGLPDRYNQGGVVITVDSDVSTAAVSDIFKSFGDVKEISEIPLKKKQKFVEFYDTRDATKAVAALNGREIKGKPVVVEFIRPGTGNVLNINNQNKHIPNIISHEVQNKPLCNNVTLKKNVYKHPKSPENAARSKPWKGPRYNRNADPRYLIKGGTDAAVVSSFEDLRTTVMIKNIPNKYSLKLLLNMLDNHCIQCNKGENKPVSSYDFVYLPIDFVNKCNVGYGFVNMTSPEATWRLYKAFDRQNWEVFNSKKICQISYARVQGLEALKEHFKNSKFPDSPEEYMPVVFTPPRDGRTLTEPVPVVSVTSIATITSPSEAKVGCNDLTCTISSDHNINNNSNDDSLLVEDINQKAESPPPPAAEMTSERGG